ncbi:TPA: DUF2076 domain-containing protein [Klebsiella pneumoniae]|nr:DUF2076 domain-containing protein [Klebsiella pneumoniae]HBW4245425.1 DUF2076 domain-containing protein [Klebsiella pneumoniae]HBW4313414.1 DUF2076 domain-containing protein [Klebsiella pneumoniae]HBW4381915.1 DUF2076 domain-containing protein [Klebsiella pneumoniae]HBW4442103.1 DUF2076 domain-containing protein [Klebsiella pneumoniae]
MTTDITELAQSEINDALAQLKQISEYPTPSTQYARVLRKYILALVEALEKAQQRISQLESRTVKLPEPFKLAKSSSGLTYYYADEVDAALTAAGIKVEAE